MKQFLFFLILCPLISMAQKPIELKKKFHGTYEGSISNFQLDSGKDVLDVDATSISVSIMDSTVNILIGKQQLNGSYSVLFEGNNYFLLDCRMENQLAGERIVVYKKGKKISRDGLYPQPSAFLYKKKD